MQSNKPSISNGPSRGLPDLSYNQSSLRSLFSNQYIRSYYRRASEACPTLKSLGETTLVRIAQCDIDRAHMTRTSLAFVLGFSISALVALSSAHLSKPVASLTQSIAVIFLLALEFLILHMAHRAYNLQLAAIRTFLTIRELELHPQYWPSSRFRNHIAHHLNRIANSIERIPLGMETVSPSTRREAFRLCRCKAQAVRDLELWATRPAAFTYTDLTERLAGILVLLAEERWYDLPEASEGAPEIPRWKRVVAITSAVLVTGGVAYVLTLKFGAASYALAIPLAAAIFGILNLAGFSPDRIERYVDAGSRLIGRR